MKTLFKATSAFLASVRLDLSRPHEFAAERVGFISLRAANTANDLILIAQDYHPLRDEDYVDDPAVGAMMSQEAIRRALNVALLETVGMIHVHMHEHRGRPLFSRTDLREQLKFVPDFFKVRRELPHGAVVFSHDRAVGRVWLGPDNVVPIAEFISVGPTTRIDMSAPGSAIDYSA